MKRISQYKRTVDALRKKVKRLEKKAEVLSQTIKILEEEKRTIPNSAVLVESGLDELIRNETMNRSKLHGRRYTPKLRAFAFTIFYYSPRAYEYIRTKFTLPTPRTIRAWLETINCQPGFLTDVLDSLSEKQNKLYSLVLDGMSIRKRIINDRSTGKMKGYCDFGGSVGAGSKEGVPAKEALVFLLVPLLERTRQPVGYFFIDKLDAQLQCSLVRQCLQMCAEKGIKIVNITCDGCPTNLATLRQLGATIPDDPFFKHPYSDHEVCIELANKNLPDPFIILATTAQPVSWNSRVAKLKTAGELDQT